MAGRKFKNTSKEPKKPVAAKAAKKTPSTPWASKLSKYLPSKQRSLTAASVSWPYLALITAHLIWGANFVVAKTTLTEIPPMSLAFIRFALATLLLAPFILVEKERVKITTKDLPGIVAAGVLMVVLNIAFFYAGISRTTVTSASVLTLTIPALSVFIGWRFLKEKIYIVNLFGIFFALLGAVAVIGLPIFALGLQDFPSQSFIGNSMIILASVIWVLGALVSKKVLKKFSTLTLTACMFMVGVVSFAIPAASEYVQNPNWPTQVSLLGFFGLIYITIASSISAYFLFEWGLRRLGVIKADLFQYLEPLIAAALGVMFLNEGLRFSTVIGAFMIVLGVYWSTLGREHHKHHKAHRN